MRRVFGMWFSLLLVPLLASAQVFPPSGGGVPLSNVTCPANQIVVGVTSTGGLVCTQVTAAMTDASLAKTGGDINNLSQVVALHLPAPLSFAQGGHGLTSGAPGGLLYFPTSTSLASSLTLAQNQPMLGGGSGQPPTTGTRTGTTTLFGTVTGPLTATRQLAFDTDGNIVVTAFIPGLPTQSGLSWNVATNACTSDGNGGKLTVNLTGQIICAADAGGGGGGGGDVVANFLPDGGTTNLNCGVSGRGAIQVMDNGELQYCDGASSPVLHVGIPTQAGLTWNVTLGTCTSDTLNGGKLTVNSSGQILCAPDAGSGIVQSGFGGNLLMYSGTGTTAGDSNVVAAQVVTATVPYTAGRIIQSAGNNRTTSDSGIATANVVTAGSPLVLGRLAQAAGNDKTLSDSGVIAANVTTAALNYVSGNLIQAAGNNKTTADSGIAASSVCTTTGVCAGYQASVTWGAGLTATGTTAAIASTEAGFLADGGSTNLTCDLGNQGKMQVMDSGELQYCDGANVSVLRRGQLTQTGLVWNVVAGTCTGDSNGGKLTVNGSGEIVCAADQGGGGGSGDISAVGTVASGEAFTDATPGDRLTFNLLAAPSTPASGKATVYVMTTAKNLAVKDDAGVVKHGVQTQAAVSNSFLTAISDAGAVTVAQPSVSTLSDASTVVVNNAINTFSGLGRITGLPAPSNASDAATKSYVDTLSAGLTVRAAVQVATTAALSATYSNGTAGVGATLTNAGTQAAISIDGVTLALNDSVLVKNQSTQAHNGLYTVTTVGTGSTNWVLTRRTDYDADGEIAGGSYVIVNAGTVNQQTLWVQTTPGPFTVGTTAIVWNALLIAQQTVTLTGDATGSGIGTVAVTVGKLNGTAFAGTNGNLVSFGASNTPADSGVVAAQVVTAGSAYTSGNLVQAAGANRTTSDSGIATNTVLTAAASLVTGNVVQGAGNNRTTSDSGVVAAQLVTASSVYVSGNLVQGAGANRTTSDSGIAAGNVVTAASNYATGRLVQAAGNNKTTSDSGIAAANVPTAAANFVTGNLLQGAGNNKTMADSGIAASTLCTTVAVCSGYQPAGSYALESRTLTVAGTSGEITVTGGSQDLSTSRTWTASLSNPLNLTGKLLSGGTPLVFEGATVNSFTTSLVITDPTANRTVTVPNADSVTVQPDTGASNQFFTAISALGVISKAQPTFSNLAGTLTCAQSPALTGDVTTSAGSCATTVGKLNGGTFAGVSGNLVSFGASNVPADSGVVAAQVVTAASAYTAGNVIQSAGANRTTSDSGVAAANLVTATGSFTTGRLVQAAGNNKTTSDSGILASTVCTTTGICTGYQGAVTWGAGLSASGTTASVASTEAGFLTDGATTDLTCGSTNQGKMQVMDNGEIQYCDGATTSVLRKGLPTQTGLSWNVTAGTCTADTNGGKLTINGSNQIVCATDQGGGGAGSITAVGTTTSGAAFADSGPGQYLTFVPIAVPGTPASNAARVYVDSLSKNLAVKDDAGVIKHGVQTKAFVATQFLTAINDAGLVSSAQPASTDLSDSATLARGTITSGTTSYANYLTAGTTVGNSSGITFDGNSVLSLKPHVTVVTNTNLTLGDTHHTLYVTTGNTNRTLTLPSAATTKAGYYKIIKADAGTGAVKVARAGSDTINGATGTADISSQHAMMELSLVDSGSPGNWHATFGTAAPFQPNPQTSTYQVTNADFAAYRTITVSTGTFTITLVGTATQPLPGQYIKVINYGSGTVTIARVDQNLNGGTASLTLPAASATSPSSAFIVSDGANYFASTAGGAVGGGASKGYVQFPMSGAHLPNSGAATIDNSEAHTRILYDATSQECAWWQFVMPQDFGTSPQLRMEYSMTSASGAVGISVDVHVSAITPGDAIDLQNKAFATANNCDDTVVPGTAGFLDQLVCPLTNMDNAAAGDLMRIRICRAPTDSADTASGDLELVGAIFEYQKN